jgi:hypothetical protein
VTQVALAGQDADVLGRPASEPAAPVFIGRRGRLVNELSGGDDPSSGIAVFSFRGAAPEQAIDDRVQFEFRTTIRRSGDEAAITDDDLTHLQVVVRDPTTGRTSDPVEVIPETNRIAHFAVPTQWVQSGDFDLVIHNRTPGHFLSLRTDAVSMVRQTEPFMWNLFKSLFSLWLLSLLVVCIAVFCSTFLSWPIAVVLTVVVLLGRWGIEQVGDTSNIKHSFVQEMVPGASPEGAKVLSQSVGALSRYMNVVARVLPDISGFSITGDIERGVAIPMANLGSAIVVAFGFGLPMVVLGYLFLKYKEVAP